jgi:sulfotransferase family protein
VVTLPGFPRVLALWSAPRSRSTAFEQMMRQRGDFTVLHEPFSHRANYGSTVVDGAEIRTEPELLRALRGVAGPVFFKDTTDFHYPCLLRDEEFLGTATHTFLIRHPRDAIASHYALHPGLGRDEIGFGWLHEIFAAVVEVSGVVPVVVDSDDLVNDPAGTVERYCALVGIPFRPEALRWRPGMASGWERSARWHQATSATTAFEPTRPRYPTSVEDSPVLAEYLRYHLPFYQRLRQHRLRVGQRVDIGERTD